jgi:hypothetical protein
VGLMKRSILFLTVFVIGFSLIFGVWALAEEPVKSIWPSSLSSIDWYWFVPNTDYLLDKVNEDLKAVRISAQNSNDLKVITGSLMTSKKEKYTRIIYELAPGTRNYYIFYSNYFNDSTSFLGYNYETSLWFLKITRPDKSYVIFCSKNEADLRKFGIILATICKRDGVTLLSLSKIGFIVENLTPAQAESLGKTRIENALVTRIAIGGPMEKSDLKVSDVITEVNGVWVKNSSDFDSLIDAFTPGSIVKLTCLERLETTADGQKKTEWKPKTVEMTVR